MTRDQHDEPSHELATVTRLPVNSDAPVVDAEIMTPEEWARVEQRRTALARRDGYRQDLVAVARVTRTAATHPATKATTRNLVYVAAGAWTVAKRRRASRTLPDRMARTAEAAGNADLVKYWHEQSEHSKTARHKRRMDWLEVPLRAARALAIGVVVWFLALLLLGIIVAGYSHDLSRAFDPVIAFVTFVGWLWWLATVGWFVAVCAGIAVTVGTLWWIGRNSGVTPAWLAPANVTRDDTITPSRVVLAFRELGISKLAKAIADMEDGGAAMLSPVVIAGCGVEVDVTLPQGVTTEEVMRRRRKLAENLGRHEHEVFPTVAPIPRTVRVWAADSGALDEPIGPSPLVYDDAVKASYRHGRAPWGQGLRGDPVEISLYQRHVLITGASNQGKTFSLRALALWLALDRPVEFRIADLKGVGDWGVFAGLASMLIEGPTDEHVVAATEMLEDGAREMNRRITAGGDFTPLILVVDEAQVAYSCPAKDESGQPYGGSKNNSRYLTAVRKIQNQGRAVDVLLWQGTQNPTNQNLPVLAREGAHLRICLAVGTDEQSRMALGDKAVDGGAAPHLLRAGLDKGTVVVAGDGAPLAAGQASVTVRTHFIADEQAAEIAGRAKASRGPVRQLDDEQPRDLLDDVFELLGDAAQVPAATMARWLQGLDPRHYRGMDGVRLKALLDELGAAVTKNKGTPTVYWDRVQCAMNERGE